MSSRLLFLLVCYSLVSTASIGQVDLSSGLVAYYPLNGNFNDSSGNGNHGTGTGGTTFAADQWNRPNSVAYFDGINDYVDIASSQSFTLAGAGTIAFRMKAMDASQHQFILSKSVYSGLPTGLQYFVAFQGSSTIHPTDALFFATHHNNSCAGNSPSNAYQYQYTQTIVQGTWYNVVMTFDGGVKKTYVNGSLIGLNTVTGAPNNASIDSCNTGSLRLGVWWAGDPYWYNGYLDEVRIYKRALNQQEVTAIDNINPLSLSAIHSNQGIVLSPAPANDFITLSAMSTAYPLTYEIVSSIGQRVQTGSAADKSERVNIERLSAGIYSMFVQAGNGDKTVLRLVKR